MIATAVVSNKNIIIKDSLIKNNNSYSEPIFIVSKSKSSSPHFPNFPPQNTPPNIDHLRKIYLNYLSKTNLG